MGKMVFRPRVFPNLSQTPRIIQTPTASSLEGAEIKMQRSREEKQKGSKRRQAEGEWDTRWATKWEAVSKAVNTKKAVAGIRRRREAVGEAEAKRSQRKKKRKGERRRLRKEKVQVCTYITTLER